MSGWRPTGSRRSQRVARPQGHWHRGLVDRASDERQQGQPASVEKIHEILDLGWACGIQKRGRRKGERLSVALLSWMLSTSSAEYVLQCCSLPLLL